MIPQTILEEAQVWAEKEIAIFHAPPLALFRMSLDKGQEIAKALKADADVVFIGTCCMDMKLGYSKSTGKAKDHVRISYDATKEWLADKEIAEEDKEKILEAVQKHHSGNWNSLEAEICANADCYRFLHTTTWLTFLHGLGTEMSFEKALDFAEQKCEEKWNILSLDICKEELTPHYNAIKEIIKLARTGNQKT